MFARRPIIQILYYARDTHGRGGELVAPRQYTALRIITRNGL